MTEKKDKNRDKKVDGNLYKSCPAWHFVAGKNQTCFEMCHAEQRNACTESQHKNAIGERK